MILQGFLGIFLHSCHQDLNSCDSMGMRCRESLHRPFARVTEGFCRHVFWVFERLLKGTIPYPDKMLHLTAIRCYIFRRKVVDVDFHGFCE